MPLRPTRQARSRETLGRIVERTEALLDGKPFEELSVAEIARQSASSVGAFYGRFPDKDALLEYLDDRMEQDAVAHWNAFFDAARWRGVPAVRILEELVRVSVAAHRRKKGLLRTVFLRIRSRPDRESLARARRLNAHFVRRATALLLTRLREMGCVEPVRSVRFALFQLGATLREAVLFEDLKLFSLALSDRALVAALTRSLASYLKLKGTRR